MKKTTNPFSRKVDKWRLGFIALCALFTSLPMLSQTIGTVPIGSGTTANYGMPMDTWNNYYYSQQIVKSSEFTTGGGVAGQITGIRFYISNALTPIANWDNWTVYVGHTAKSAFTSATDWEPVANLTQVFAGTITPVNGQWMEITFSTPFPYNGTSNLIVAVDENAAGKTDGSSATFFGQYTGTTNTGLRIGGTTDINPASPTAGTLTATLARLQFVATLASCLPPTNVHASNVQATTATLEWTAPQVAADGGYQYYISTTNTAPTGTSTLVDASGLSVPLSNLTANTQYYVWARSKCGTNFSAWSEVATFTTPCTAVGIPYSENFESVTTPALPSCTTSTRAVATGNFWATNSPGTTAFGTKVIRHASSSVVANTWFFTRGINLTAGTSYRISYKYGATAGYTEKLKVGYGTATQADAMTQLADHPTVAGAAANNNYVDFIPQTTGVYYFGFQAYSAAYQNSLYLDDILVDLSPACINPTGVTATTAGTTSVNLAWTASTAAPSAGYQYYYATTNTAPTANETNTHNVATGITTTVNGLTSATTYYFWVRGNCGTNGYSTWSAIATATTDCDAANVPYVQDFESVTTPALPVCTTAVRVGTTGNIWATFTPTTGPFASTKVLRYSYSTTTAANTWFFTRGINLTAGTSYRISYKYGSVGFTEKLEVGYGMTADAGAMTQVADHPSITGTTSTPTYVDFIAQSTGVHYIGFHAYSAVSQNYLYVDDIMVDVTPTCSAPTALVVNSFGQNEATISWTPDGVSAGYQYYYSTTNTAPVATTTPMGSVTGNETTANLESLLPNTIYYVWVRNNCGNNDLSAWSASATFRTLCDAANIPYTEDFESVTTPALPLCTLAVNEGTGSTWRTISPNAYGITSKAIYYPASFSSAAFAWFYTRGLNLTAGTTYRLSYRYSNSSTTLIEKLEVAYGQSTQSGAMLSLADHPAITGAAATNTYIDFTAPSTGVYYVGFKVYSDVGQSSLYVDDISVIVAPTCNMPTALVTNTASITENSASVSWTPDGISTGYQYYYSTTNTTPAATQTPNGSTDANTLTATFNGLTPNTVYYAWVRNNCGGGDLSAWSLSTTFRTLCDATNVPYTEDFESVTTPALPECTSVIRIGTTGNRWTTATPAAYGFTTKALRYSVSFSYAANTWFFTRGINLTAGTSYRITYKYGAGGYTEKLEVAYGTSTTAESMLQLADHPSITGNTPLTNFVDFIPATSGVYYFGFKAYSASSQNYLMVDDISVNLSPSCINPTGLTANAVNTTSVALAWNAASVAPANGYQYYYSTTNTAPTATETNTHDVTTGITTTVSGLTSATTYYFWVRSNCGNNDYSAWSAVASVVTPCDAVNVPYTENFESVTTPALPLCTSVVNAGNGNMWATASPGTTAFNSKVLRYGYTTSAAANTWFFTRGVNLTAGTSYRLSYRYGNASFTEKLKVSYGTSPAVASMATTPLADHPSITGTSNVSTYVDFIPATSGVYYFGFHAYSAASQNALYLDDIKVDLSPACITPAGLTATAAGTTSINLAWNAASVVPANGYQYYYSTTNTAPTANETNTHDVTTGTSAAVGNLTSATTYYFWLRSNCGTDGYSEWSSVVSASTPCEAVNVPYEENFESVTTPALPVCFSAVNNGAGSIWTTASPNAFGFTSKAIRVAYASAGGPNTWFFTRGVNLTAGTTYKLTYKYGGSSFVEKLKISYGTSPAVASMATTALADHPNITGNTPSNGDVDFIPETSGVYYFGFHAYSAAGQNSLYVDDIKVDAVLGSGSFDIASFKYYPNPVKDVLNLSYSSDITAVAVYNLLGQQVLAKDVNATEASLDMSALADGTYIVNVSSGDSVKTIKVIKKQ